MAKLGVNIDHVATLRQARRELDPDPIQAALICERAGADSIVAHLREDERHINEKDVRKLKKALTKRFNLEMSLSPRIIDIALSVKPDQVTLVPEKRQEVTTEGGLDVVKNFNRIVRAAKRFQEKNIEVSLFIDPVKKQIDKTKEAGINMIELHTGCYDRMTTKQKINTEFKKIKEMTEYAHKLGIIVCAGHGLKYNNTRRIANIKHMHELNIGHSIITEAVFTGLSKAVREMKKLVK